MKGFWKRMAGAAASAGLAMAYLLEPAKKQAMEEIDRHKRIGREQRNDNDDLSGPPEAPPSSR